LANTAVQKGGGVYAHTGSVNYNTIAFSFAPEGAGLYISDLIHFNHNTIVSNFGEALREPSGDQFTVYNAFVDNGPVVISGSANPEIFSANNLYFNTIREGDYWLVNETPNDLFAPYNFFWLTDSSEIDSRIWDDEESGGTSGTCQFSPYFTNFVDGAPGEPTSVTGVEIYQDSAYSIPFEGIPYPGDTLYLQLTGTSRNDSLFDYALLYVKSSNDTNGILVGLLETDTASGIFRGFAVVDFYSEDLENRILSGDWIAVISVIDSTYTDTVSGPLSYVCGDCNGNGVVNVIDLAYFSNYIFDGGPPPIPLNSGDVNGDCTINVADLSLFATYLFVGGPNLNCCPSRRLPPVREFFVKPPRKGKYMRGRM
jgi:hypothetical protein